jgi:hypothetical protein
MRLHVWIHSSNLGVTKYGIERDGRAWNRKPNPKDAERIQKLLPRIEAMGRMILGRNFKSLRFHPNTNAEVLLLGVKAGTSKENRDFLKFKLREYLGWICWFDAEPAPN